MRAPPTIASPSTSPRRTSTSQRPTRRDDAGNREPVRSLGPHRRRRRGELGDRARQTAIGRNGQLEDLRGLAVLLASRGSDYVTGQVIMIDGGFTAK
ncbi:MAG: SDR family oxidoreductase [Alphaproteobacteria bacterium]|nr:SDR family oxidoreductase [Alphaproteobacteria bacterium]